MAGFALSVGEAGFTEFVLTVFARFDAFTAETLASVAASVTTACAGSMVATAAARKAIVTDAGITLVAAANLVGRNRVAAITALRTRPFVELGIRAAGVVSVQDLIHELEKIGQTSRLQRP